jgi:nitroreductase
MTKRAETDYPINDLAAKRWSPYCFSRNKVSCEDLCSLFEAARWAASSYNEQPWSYILARQEQNDEFQRLLSCLVEANQCWAGNAPVLALGIASLNFSRNNKPNRAAIHDLGQASASLALEATARGLYVHQMIGILPDKARELYAIPEGHEPMTAIAIGYAGEAGDFPQELGERDANRRPRKPLEEFVFGSNWGNRSDLFGKR